MSTNRINPRAGWARRKDLVLGPNGRACCRECGAEVPKGRRTFCSDDCVTRWKIRSDPGFIRDQVFRRDRGVCAGCSVDTVALVNSYRSLDWPTRRARLRGLGIPPHRAWAPWDADHIVPVAEGGGESDLSNFRTLCIPCHRSVTAELRRRLAARRKAEKERATQGLFAQIPETLP
jgi:5-methylcytosine-specific restriction protein A